MLKISHDFLKIESIFSIAVITHTLGRPPRGMRYEGVECTQFHLSSYQILQLEQNSTVR